MFRKTFYSAVVLLVVLSVAGFFVSREDVYSTFESAQDAVRQNSSSLFLPHPAFAQTGVNASIADVAEKCIDSVVNISSTKVVQAPSGGSPFFDNPFFRDFFGPNFQPEVPRERRERSLGSGVIVDKEGIILTNNHVVENAEELKVTLHDGREFDGEVVGTDPATDVAVIRLKGKNFDNLKPISFGDSEVLRLGDVVLAIGNPFGLSHTVTMGIVSAKGRSFTGQQRITEYEDFIQTDAAINPGNSGGALVNLKGELVGINTAIVSGTGGYQGIGFAIPSNMAKTIMQGLIEHGKIVRGWLGVSIQDITPDIAQAMSLDTTEGVMVADVVDDSPAEKAGIETGDIIVRVNNEKIDSANHLRNKIAMLGAEKKVTVTVLRDGRERAFNVTLGELDESVMVASGRGGGRGGASSIDGFTVAPLSNDAREKYNIPDTIKNGVIVTNVDPAGNAASSLRQGDVILEINRNSIDSVSDFTDRFKNAGDSVLLYVFRGGSRFFTVIRKN